MSLKHNFVKDISSLDCPHHWSQNIKDASVEAVDCVKRPRVRYPFCLDKFDAREGHTMCLGAIRQRLMNETARNLLEKLHNDLRSSVNPPAANMMVMQYNQVLEKEAQIWAEQCKMSHDKPDLRFVAGRFAVGQNIAKNSAYNWTNVFEQWKGENGSFKYGGKNNATAVQDLAQMITAETSLLGCGVSKCGTDYFYVCNYAPVMDSNNIDTPYIESKSGKWCDSCSKVCDNVTSHLCDCFGKFCINGGVMDLQTCTCNCIKEVQTYDPEHCELKCDKDGDDKTRCGKPPYDKSTCRSNPGTAFYCPWMCDICPYAGMNYSSEGVASLPWEKGLPNCTSTTLTHPMSHPLSHPNGLSTGFVKQSTPSTNHNGTKFGSNNRNSGSFPNNFFVQISVYLMIAYFAAEWLCIF